MCDAPLYRILWKPVEYFSVALQTNKQTNKQTNTDENITALADVNMRAMRWIYEQANVEWM